jgi:putative oxidoreductase
MWEKLDSQLIRAFNRWSIPALRIALAVVYIWFGALKIANVSPVAGLVQSLYPSFPEPLFLAFLGVWEVLIGLGLLSGVFLRGTLALLWLQMGGIMLGLVTDPALFFQHSNPLLLNTDGEFLIKNLVLIAASLVVAGYQIKPWRKITSL